jgi:hypothetical protein
VIIGQCPYEDCDGTHMVPLARDVALPCFEKLTCEYCLRPYWMKHSRILPECFTPDEFAAEYHVDEKTKVITRRDAVQQS